MNSETPEARNPVVDLEDDRRQMLDATTKQYRSHIDEGKHSTTSRKGDVPLQRRESAKFLAWSEVEFDLDPFL